MASLVFMRAVNVGGHQVIKPAALARKLSSLDVVNVGAAGTFVVRASIRQDDLRAELIRRLPIKAQFMICRGQDLKELVSMEPFPTPAAAKDVRYYVSVIARRPPKLLPLPVSQPAGKDWQVKIIGVHKRFVLSQWRRLGKAMLYPNEVVEKKLGVDATSRTWDTFLKLHRLVQEPSRRLSGVERGR